MSLAPEIAIHVTAALGAVVIGPVALWARKGGQERPKLHRAAGYAWVTLMLIAAISAVFIRSSGLPNIAGFSPIHLLIPVVFGMLFLAFWFLAKGKIRGHRMTMQGLYIGGCLVAGAFTLMPGRLLGELIWVEWLGLLAPHVHPIPSPQGASMTFPVAQILANTPLWVWGLLVALLALGYSQARDRSASLVRITVMPVAMTTLSIWGTASAFGSSPMFGYTMLAWMFAAALFFSVITPTAAPRGTSYDPATRTFAMPGSWVPMLLILGIFMTKYVVGVGLAMDPGLARNGQYTLVVGTLYGLFSGVFAGRAARLWVLARRSMPSGMPALNT